MRDVLLALMFLYEVCKEFEYSAEGEEDKDN